MENNHGGGSYIADDRHIPIDIANVWINEKSLKNNERYTEFAIRRWADMKMILPEFIMNEVYPVLPKLIIKMYQIEAYMYALEPTSTYKPPGGGVTDFLLNLKMHDEDNELSQLVLAHHHIMAVTNGLKSPTTLSDFELRVGCLFVNLNTAPLNDLQRQVMIQLLVYMPINQ
jgi:hypothetical protein